jgi:RNA polymerase sigma-70 factor (ECF subfamily)
LSVALGCTRATARVRLHRARRRFADALRREGVTASGAHLPSTFEPEEARP